VAAVIVTGTAADAQPVSVPPFAWLVARSFARRGRTTWKGRPTWRP
jgi:hypothetical protein